MELQYRNDAIVCVCVFGHRWAGNSEKAFVITWFSQLWWRRTRVSRFAAKFAIRLDYMLAG